MILLWQKTLILTLEASPVVGGNVTDITDAGPYYEGTGVSVTAKAKDVYQFVNWTVGTDNDR